MKLVAIVEVSDEMYDEYKEWYISDDGIIRYEEDGALMSYKDFEDIKLKELPQRKPIYYEAKTDEVERNIGFNKCIDEITGKEK